MASELQRHSMPVQAIGRARLFRRNVIPRVWVDVPVRRGIAGRTQAVLCSGARSGSTSGD